MNRLDQILWKWDGRTTAEEWIRLIPGDLPRDAVALADIIPAGRHDFGLSGQDLIEFTRRSLFALLRKGARPAFGRHATPGVWHVAERFGRSPAEIVDSVIAEWLAVGAPDPHPAGPEPGQPEIIGLWFATPNIYQDGGKPPLEPPQDLAVARNRWDARTVDEWIADRMRELDVAEVGPNDPVGMWLIPAAGRYDFGLQGEMLAAFVRRALLALLRAGAMPVTPDDTPDPNGWKVLEECGGSQEEIAEAIIAEWLAMGGGNPDDRVWFARPDRIKQA